MKIAVEKEFLTIKEVAESLGISRQAVYNKLDKEFKPYLTIQNGKKLLNYKVLQGNKEDELSSDVDKNIQSFVNLLDRQYEQLSRELDIKNRQLEVKDEQLSVKDKQIDELNARLAETTAALVTAQQTAQAAQALHAGTIRQQLEIGNVSSPTEVEETPPKKQGIFTRIFKKDTIKNS